MEPFNGPKESEQTQKTKYPTAVQRRQFGIPYVFILYKQQSITPTERGYYEEYKFGYEIPFMKPIIKMVTRGLRALGKVARRLFYVKIDISYSSSAEEPKKKDVTINDDSENDFVDPKAHVIQ